ncbi:hypothetical protein Clacol_005507 [Clathrus columnatus]|uniref:Actin interacting protein 3 C-terminal domain-containing protein n=1 Tax=Clathrus columnatus TaxID=1419009 RepID=A0AAV5AH62_9AGAM|nr:hypothetical protein Clacol_005507 [Clathrus columnatus]
MSAYPSSTPPSTYHRHTNSTSSQASQASRHGGRRDYSNPAVETAVTRLLVAIKELLESLTDWSKGTVSETDVSDVYVRLGNDFNAAVAAFSQCSIDMRWRLLLNVPILVTANCFHLHLHSELMSVPNDLRHILEACLSEDPSQAVLDLYLPDVRTVITNLLHGLRAKQTIYRRMIERSRASTGSTSSRSSRTEHSRARTSLRDSQRESRTSAPRREREVVSEHDPPRSDDQYTPSPDHKNSPSHVSHGAKGGYSPTPSALASVEENNEAFVPPINKPGGPGFTPTPVPSSVARYSLSDPPVQLPPKPTTSITEPPVVLNGPSNLNNEGNSHADEFEPSPLPTPEKDYIITDATRAPAMESSLNALKKTEAFGRRASKRFSTYNISKIAGTKDKPGLSALDKLTGGDDKKRNRRSAMFGATLTPGELESLAEESESPTVIKSPIKAPSRADSVRRDRSESTSSPRRQPRTYSPSKDAPPVPPVPETASNIPTLEVTTESGKNDHVQLHDIDTPSSDDRHLVTPPATEATDSVIVFLKVGLQVKKLTLEREGLSIPSLRLHFTEKFSYNPGLENFPAIYINDPSSHIQYELEDMDDIKDKSLLSLNIEPLDQIKQHIDLQISNLTQDIKDLKTAISTSRRQSLPAQASNLSLTQSPTVARPSESQFANIARRVARLSKLHNDDGKITKMLMDDSIRSPSSSAPHHASSSSIIPQMTGNSVAMSDIATSRFVVDLKTQFDEVQNLRRDLGVVRQLYTDFMTQTKESLSTLRTQTASVRDLASTKIGGARAFIDTGKANMDKRSQNILTKVEELQDMVETLKHDVLKRHVSPKSNMMQTLKADIETTAKELESLTEHIQTVKPMWKKTWEEELQNIVEEQQFLSYQEEFMNDLSEDHKALTEVFGHIEKVISLRSSTGSAKARFRPPPMEEGHSGLSTVMLEIQGAAVDPERRLKAIAANQKNREKELASRTDEFQNELNGFVQGKKLKLTGGTEEAERMRQKRNEITLKRLFSSGSQTGLTQPELPPEANK